jgi:positive regulator of sigma E activity
MLGGVTVDGQIAYSARGRARLVVKRDSRACPSCAGACAWSRAEGSDETVLEIDSGLAPGSQVAVTMPGKSLLLCAGVVYGVPLLAMLAGAAAASEVFGTDAAAMIGTLVGSIVGYASSAGLGRRVQRAALAGLSIRKRR